MGCFYRRIFLTSLNLKSDTLKVEGGSMSVVWRWKAEVRGLTFKSSVEYSVNLSSGFCAVGVPILSQSGDGRT